MAEWAFECTHCGDPQTRWFIACDTVAEFPADTTIVHVKVKSRWVCARLNRARRVSVESGLLRSAVPAGAADCDDCKDR